MKNNRIFLATLVALSLMVYSATANATIRIMPLGDSITQGCLSGVVPNEEAYWVAYRKALWDKLVGAGYEIDFVGSLKSGSAIPNFDPDHEGHAAWRADDILNGRPGYGKLEDWLKAYNPQIILLHIGTNGLKTSPDDVEDILDEIDKYDESIWVILARIINRECCTDSPPCSECATTTTFNNNVEAMAQARIQYGDRIILVDMENGADFDYREKPVGDMNDNLHPYETGYTKMADVWFNALKGFLPILKWEFATTGGVRSCPAIGSDGTVYVGSMNSKLYAINPDGTEKWAFQTGDMVNSSPAIDSESTIYVGSLDGKLYAINPDGTEKWAFTTTFWSSIFSSPAIGSDGTIYVGSESPDCKLHAINPNGTLKWAFQTENRVNSSPAIGSDGTVYIGSDDGKLYAINSDGTLKWAFQAWKLVRSSPAISSDGTIYVGSVDKNIYAINPNGTKKWTFTTGDKVDSSPAIGSDGTVYVGSNEGKVYAINPSGAQKWTFETGDYVLSSPAIGSDGTVYVGSGDTWLYAINSGGTLKWAFSTGSDILSSPAIGSDGTVYVGSMDGKVYAIKSSSDGLANSPWPIFHHDLRHTGRISQGTPTWLTSVYSVIFDSPSDLALFRQYRDELLNKTAEAQLYIALLYKDSDEALEVLLKSPKLMLQAKNLIEANKATVSEVINGGEGAIYNLEEALSFLDAFAKKSPPALRVLADMAKKEMLEKQRLEKAFLGFRLPKNKSEDKSILEIKVE